MTISRLAKRLVSIVRPPSLRLALLVSRAITRRELEFYGLIFDEIIVANPSEGAANKQDADLKVLYATSADKSMTSSQTAGLNSGAAIWVQRDSVGIIAIRQPASDETIILHLRRGGASTAAPLELDVNDLDACSGAVSSGNLHPIRHLDGAAFLLVNEDEGLLRILAAAARADIENRLFFGPTGFEP